MRILKGFIPGFTSFFQEANLKGYITYQGRRLTWPKPIIQTKDALEFSYQQIVGIQRGVPSAKAEAINPSAFSRFIKQYDFHKTEGTLGKLIETEGILAKHPKNTPLVLYVTEKLNASQWSQLLAECKQLGVTLQVNLAPGITLPIELADTIKVPEDIAVNAHESTH